MEGVIIPIMIVSVMITITLLLTSRKRNFCQHIHRLSLPGSIVFICFFYSAFLLITFKLFLLEWNHVGKGSAKPEDKGAA